MRLFEDPDSPYRLGGYHAVAHAEVHRAVRRGLLPKASDLVCVDCGVAAVEYDHRDYNRPLAVEPVCRSCNLFRGPGILPNDFIEYASGKGIVVYVQRERARQLLEAHGKSCDVLCGMPKKLGADHWRLIWPVLARATAGAVRCEAMCKDRADLFAYIRASGRSAND